MMARVRRRAHSCWICFVIGGSLWVVRRFGKHFYEARYTVPWDSPPVSGLSKEMVSAWA